MRSLIHGWVVGVGLGLCAESCAVVDRDPLGRIIYGVAGTVELDEFLRAHPLSQGQALQADLVERTGAASYHVVQVATHETPHRHAAHDLAVTVLRGGGTLHLADRTVEMTMGDTAIVPRGVAHWFERVGGEVAVAFVTFAPPLDAPDMIPLGIDSAADHQ